jgi:hypothetical protein
LGAKRVEEEETRGSVCVEMIFNVSDFLEPTHEAGCGAYSGVAIIQSGRLGMVY